MTIQKPDSESKRKSAMATVRMNPKLKYLAGLAARRQRRTLSSYIEWAIEDSLSREATLGAVAVTPADGKP